MSNVTRDLRFALTLMARSPLLYSAVVLCLALGIGANSAVFTVVNALLIRPLPYADPDRIVALWGQMPTNDQTRMPASPEEFLDYRRQARSLIEVSGVIPAYMNLTGTQEPERFTAARVSASLFRLLGVKMAAGRAFLPQEETFGNHRQVILGYGLWQRRFGRDPGVAGRKLLLNDEPYTVVGVTPPGLALSLGGRDNELWVPLAFDPQQPLPRSFRVTRVLARLKPGVTLEQAQAEMDTLANRFLHQYPDVYPSGSGWGVRLVPWKEDTVGQVRPALRVLTGAVALVLLIACANVANLLLSQATARRQEVALRAALGASRRCLIQQFLTEALLLSLLGGAFGLLLAYAEIRFVHRLHPAKLPRLEEITLDTEVLALTLGISLLAGLLFGLLPALQGTKSERQNPLRQGWSATDQRSGRLRAGLVVAEIAVAMVVLFSAVLLTRSFQRLMRVDPGFRPENVLTLQLFLSKSSYAETAQQAAYLDRLLRKIRELPGATHAGGVSWLPLGEFNVTVEGEIESFAPPQGEPHPTLDWRAASPEYFSAMSIPLRRGRVFTEADYAGAPLVAVVDENFANRYWPGQDPLGRRVKILGLSPTGKDMDFRVIGVTAHVKVLGLDRDAREQIYTSFAQTPQPYVTLVVRSRLSPTAMTTPLRKAVWSVDPNQALTDALPMEEILDRSLVGRRSYMLLFGLFALIATILVALGVYSVTSYAVAQRTREIGVRMALGAERGQVLRLLLRGGLLLTVVGLAVGLLLSLASREAVASLLFGIAATDLATLAGAALLLVLVAFVAIYLPARRAASVDPAKTLRGQ